MADVEEQRSEGGLQLCDRHVVGKERESDIAVNPVVVGVDQLERRREQWRGAGSWP